MELLKNYSSLLQSWFWNNVKKMWTDYSYPFLSNVIAEVKNPKTQEQIRNEFRSLLTSSIFPCLVILILVCFHWDTMIASWIMILYISRKINKAGLPMFEQTKKDVKAQLIGVKIAGMTLGLVTSTIGIEIVVYLSLMIFAGDKSQRVEQLFSACLIRFLQFLQYFSFYRLYLYVFMLIGSYVMPKINDKYPLPKNEKKD